MKLAPRLQFLKLGGSLITDKSKPSTPFPDVISRLAAEIAAFVRNNPGDRLVIGHGSGSFGHFAGKKYNTRQGVHSPEQWLGFAEVWRQASMLHRLVIEALAQAGLPAVSFPPSAGVLAREGKIVRWELKPLQRALEHGLVPVIYGDVVFDEALGGTILSTEDLFNHLAVKLHPARILLAGLEPGVWEDYPKRTRLLAQITPHSLPLIEGALQGSSATDVTGGMVSKVHQSLELCGALDGLEVWIFSGSEPGALTTALSDTPGGTVIRAANHQD